MIAKKKSARDSMGFSLNNLHKSLTKFIVKYETLLDLSSIDQGKNCKLEPEDFEYLESLHATEECKRMLYQILQEWFNEDDYKKNSRKYKKYS